LGDFIVSRFSLASYTLRIHDDIKEEYVPFGNFDRENHDFFDFLIDYFTYRKSKLYKNEKDQKMMTIIDFNPAGRKINGTIEEGGYGEGSNMRDERDSSLSYKTKYQAVMPPFYFILEVPEHYDEGIILLQRTKGLGCKGSLWADLNDCFKKKFNYYSIEMNSLVPKEFIKEMLTKRITKFRFLSFKIPSTLRRLYLEM